MVENRLKLRRSLFLGTGGRLFVLRGRICRPALRRHREHSLHGEQRGRPVHGQPRHQPGPRGRLTLEWVRARCYNKVSARQPPRIDRLVLQTGRLCLRGIPASPRGEAIGDGRWMRRHFPFAVGLWRRLVPHLIRLTFVRPLSRSAFLF